jgi:hypothetical protein
MAASNYPNDKLRKKQKYIAMAAGAIIGLVVYAISHYVVGAANDVAIIWWLVTTIASILIIAVVLMKTNPGDTTFTDEMNRILAEHENDDKGLYKALLAIESEPKSQTEADVYHINLATALMGMNRKKDAEKELDKVDMSNKETVRFVRRSLKN